MNELRWILLVAGALLIAGLYLWGTRTRWQGRSEAEASKRPAVFTGGARGFETEVATPQDDDEVDVDMAESVFRTESRAERRIEPGFDQDEVDTLMHRDRDASISTTRATSNLLRSDGANRL